MKTLCPKNSLARNEVFQQKQLFLLKMNTMKTALFLALTALSNFGFSQSFNDSIILLNGNVFRGKVVGLTEEYLTFKSQGKKGVEDLRIEHYRIFSYTQDDLEKVMYTYDTTIGNFLTVDESRKFALGSYDARKTFSSRPVFYSSIAAGYAVSLFDTYLTQKRANDLNNQQPTSSVAFKSGFFGRQPSILPLAMPLTLGISFGLTNVRVKDEYILQKGLKNDPFYYEGFNRVAKQQRTFSALKGSVIGVALGYISYALLQTNEY